MDTICRSMLLNIPRAVEGEATPFSIHGGSRPGMLLDLTRAVEGELAPLPSRGHSRPSMLLNMTRAVEVKLHHSPLMEAVGQTRRRTLLGQ